jgi:hypothetical protein
MIFPATQNTRNVRIPSIFILSIGVILNLSLLWMLNAQLAEELQMPEISAGIATSFLIRLRTLFVQSQKDDSHAKWNS